MTPAQAREELLTKTIEQIHEETADTWATRALAARQLFVETHDLRWASAFTDCSHEALEHAALSANDAALAAIRARLRAP